MDTVIKDKEIQTSIAKLKNNKSSGVDSIKNEMIKASATILLPCLHKLFNLIFFRYYPSLWAKNCITALFKTDDNSDYRGITITSNTGKHFNMILHSRLDKFLEDNQIINNVQIGFTKNAKTSDHMFVLKSLIDKCINTNGDKLYSYFVDFRKAFDSVIHPGLQLKLKELNINGKFYDILGSLYAKSSVKLGEYHTDLF